MKQAPMSVITQFLTLNRVTLALSESVDVAQRQQLQRQISTALEQVSIYPTMPPHAILVVRHLADPKPEVLLGSNRWQGVRHWEQAVQTTINDCWRTAVRVVRSPVDVNANSVWFADRAEWLACLSWDLARGMAGDRWWWETALRPYQHLNQREILYPVWQESARWLPASLDLLTHYQPSGLGQILNLLTATQAAQLLAQMAEIYHFSLPEAPEFVVEKLQRSFAVSIKSLLSTLPPVKQMLVVVGCNLAIAADVQLILQDSANVALLENQPNPQLPDVPNQAKIGDKDGISWQKTPEFAQEGIATTDLKMVEIKKNTPLELDSTVASDLGEESLLATDLNSPVEQSDFEFSNQDNHPVRGFKIVEIKNTPLESDSTVAPDLGEESLLATDLNSPVEQSDFEFSDPDNRPVTEPVFPLIAEENIDATQGVKTSVGGLWYVVNILVDLDWFGRSPMLTPWQQLLHLSQALLPEIPPDPVWGLLNEIVLEPLPHNVVSQWQSEILSLVANYLNLELELPKSIADYILAPATLYLTRTHIDVVFSLEQIQFDLRIVGLDRDPGWVPELARVIAFHYE